MAEAARWLPKSGPYLGEISALAFLNLPSRLASFPILLAGTGSQVLAYNLESGRLLCSFHAFRGVRVHGLSPRGSSLSSPEDLLVVYGERRVKLLRLMVDGDGREVSVRMEVHCWLQRFDHWVLDALFVEGGRRLAVGLSDNSIAVWDVFLSKLLFRVKSPERCLLYSMRLWGEDLETLCVASGTIFNEILVWKFVSQIHHPEEHSCSFNKSCCKNTLVCEQHYVARNLGTLTGHNGSIFRMAWSSDGSKLLSASDDRSARIWLVNSIEKKDDDLSLVPHGDQVSNNLVLFGHDARIWDGYVSDSVVITVGEDCTCRVWDMDGNQIMMLKEHLGRGIWRCLYDPNTSLLVTAGFDSAIQVHLFPSQLCKNAPHSYGKMKNFNSKTEIFSIGIPCASEKRRLTDSKSEYVRCLRLHREDSLYVATNNGYLYHAKLSHPGDVQWTQLMCVDDEAPIICMDLMPMNLTDSSVNGDQIAFGDGKGNATVLRVADSASSPKVVLSFTWLAEKERQLLGIHWCKSIGCSHVFTADPRGTLRMWKVPGSFECASGTDSKMANVSPVAVFSSCFGSRILCLDISMREEILICGDLHGNLVLFPLSNVLLNEDASKLERRILSLADFKGAHGISSVTSILIGKSSSYQIDLHTTGGDGCICSFNYNRDLCSLEFLGMKHVKELSLIQSIVTNSRSLEDSEQWHCAIGFTSTDFIIWNLKDESKMLQVPCGGWRRPYSYFLGCVPELQNCFAFLKDHKIHICKLWEPTFERPLFPQILNIQCHGREIHSSCFISIHIQQNLKKTKNLWVATGSEDGTVRLTRYRPDLGNWSASLLLGEHVGGSAVRSLCFISEIYSCGASQRCTSNGISMCNSLPNKDNYQCLLISVGAKQVLTLWLLKDRVIGNSVELHTEGSPSGRGTDTSMEECSSISFQWLSTHMPRKLNKVPEMRSNASKGKLTFQTSGTSPLSTETNLETSNAFMSGNDDWRYLAVTAFIVKGTDRLKVCFVVVACSDATLTLRALLLPQRFWFDVASLVSQVSPVLSLQHVVIPTCHRTECNEKITNLYIVVSGSTDGTIAFWDLTLTVDQFMQCVLKLQLEKMTSSQGRPRTGRGSQGGRWWKSLDNYSSKKGFVDASKGMPANLPVEKDTVSMQPCGFSSEPASGLDSIRMYNEAANGSRMHVSDRSSFPGETHELQPLHVLRSVHQSGVNCLHVSKVMHYEDESKPSSICCVVSGGDDQALSCFFFDVAIPVSMQCVAELNEDGSLSKSPSVGIRYVWECYLSSVSGYQFRVLHSHKVISAHSSAVKGVWSDGIWAFSTGLDQRIRFWRIDGTDCVRLSEHAHLIISVPEPESLDAVTCDGSLDRYQIVVTGRGMQMVEFSP